MPDYEVVRYAAFIECAYLGNDPDRSRLIANIAREKLKLCQCINIAKELSKRLGYEAMNEAIYNIDNPLSL